tara:strand:- start:136 stop:303 length:168 start_codon:yes stop_codon:yes gene_type:complete
MASITLAAVMADPEQVLDLVPHQLLVPELLIKVWMVDLEELLILILEEEVVERVP